MTRAAIYARVSSAAQRDSHTIENQLRTLPAFVKGQGWELVGTYIDDGRSAKSGQLERREGFAKLLADAEAKKFDVLVVVDVDRLTRTDDMRERAAILGPFQKNKIDIVTPAGGRLDLQTFLGEFYVTMQALFAAEENRKRAERIKAGKQRAIAEGRKPAGPTPYGLKYDRATGTFTLDEEAAEIVREIYRRVAAGETCVRVADDLARRGVRGPKKGWSKEAVYRSMTKKYTCGEWLIDKRRNLTLTVPRILSDEMWLDAQRALTKAQRRGLNRTKHNYLLQSISRCSCGSPIVIRSGVTYYNAQRQLREHPAAYLCRDRKKNGCTEPIVYCKDLDARVWAALSAELAQPDLIEALAEAEVRRADDVRDWSKDVEGYRAHLARLDKVEADFLKLRRRGEISDGAWAIERPLLERERNMVAEQLDTALRAVAATASAQERMRAAGVTVERLRAALPIATPEQRRALLRELVRDNGVVISDGRARIDLRLVRQHEQRQASEPTLAVVRAPGYTKPHEAELKIRLVA